MGEGFGGSLMGNARILAGGFLAFFSLNVLNSSYSTVLALIKADLGLTYTMSGALMSAFFAGYTMGQIPWGIMADRFGSGRVMSASIMGISLSTLLFASARGFPGIVAGRFLMGLLGAGVFVPGVRLISNWITAEARGTALGTLSLGGSIGLVISSWTTPYLATSFGWRWTMSAYGLIGVAAASLIWLGTRDRPTEPSSSRVFDGFRELFVQRSFWFLALVQMVRLGATYTFTAWLPLLLQEEFGMGLVAAGAAFSLFNLVGMVSNPAGGFASDRLGERRVLAASFALLGLISFAFTALPGGLAVYLGVLGLGWFINFVRSPSFAIIPRLYGVEMAGKVSGVQNTFASFGALVLPFVMGYVRDATASYWAGWTLLSLLLGLVAVSTALMPERPQIENDKNRPS